MAVETVEVRLDEIWKVLSFDNVAVVSWQVTSFAEALFFVSDTAPAAGSFVGQTTRVLEPTIFGSAKVYARAVRDSAKVTVQRTVNAGNAAAAPILQALSLSAAALQTTTPSGTVIGTVQNRLAGSTLTLTSSRRRLALSADGASLLVGLTPASPGKLLATIREEHPDAGARDTTLELTVTAPALSISGTPPAAVEGQDYLFTPVVSAGFGTRSFRLSGSLPAGWSVSSTTGAIFAPGAFVKAALSPVAGGTITVSDEAGSASVSIGAITVGAGAGAGGSIFPLAIGLLALADGDSISSQPDGRSLAGHIEMAAAGRINFHPLPSGSVPGSVGTGGRTAAQTLAAAPGVIAAYPANRLVVIHIGTNSVNGTPNVAQIISDITATIDLYNAANMWVIFSSILPKNGTAELDQARRDVNAAIAALSGRRLTIVNHDATHPLSDTSWQGTDGLPHPSVAGTKRMAQNIVAAMSFVAANVSEELTGTNLIANPTFTGTAGLVASGFPGGTTAPDGWRLQNDTGATMAASIVTESGVRKMQIDVSGSATTAALPFVFSRNNDTTLALLAGEWLEGKMDVEITGAGGAGDPVGIDGWRVAAGESVIFDDANGPSVYGNMSQSVSGPARVLPIKSAADQASRTFAFRVQFAVGAVSARFKLSLPVALKRSA